jgi:methyl-accepting chemotaxis protein
VTQGLEDAAALSADAGELLVQVSDRLDTVASTAQTVAGNPIVDAVANRLLTGAVTKVVSGPWNALQDRLGGMRERVLGISNAVQAVDEAVPFIELPGTITGVVTDVDARWTALDERVQEMEQLAADGVATAEQASRVAQIATEASTRLDAVSHTVGQVHGAIETAQGDVQHAVDQVDGLLMSIAIIVCLVAIWVGLLHLLLIAQGRRWIREG